MIDITKIAIDELEKDLQESKDDIEICEIALANDLKNYSNGSVQERLKVNQHCVEVITKEINRRKTEEKIYINKTNTERNNLIAFVNEYMKKENVCGSLVPVIEGGVQRIYSIGTPKEYTDQCIDEAIEAYNKTKS
jgi:hypothetical protein